MQTIHSAVRQFIIDNFMFGQDGSELQDGESLLNRGIIDSTGVLELVGFLESHFGIVVEDHELVPANLDSIERLVRFVDQKMKARPQTQAAGV